MKTKLQSLRILIVDDEREIAEILAEDFNGLGANTIAALNGIDGFAAYLKFGPDVILSDVRMSGGDGLEMLSKIRATNPLAPPHCFMMSGYSTFPKQKFLDLGAQGFIEKPFRIQEIRELLRTVNEKK
jgi:CheY-like chemotaxis protein